MKVFLYGYGTFGKSIYRQLLNSYEIDIVGIIENRKKTDRTREGVKIYTIDEFKEEYSEVACVIIAIIEPRGAFDAWKSVEGIANRIFRVPVECQEYSVLLSNDGRIWSELIDISINNLPYVEMHVQDNCNLNCAACAHYSPLFESNELTFEEFTSDIARLREIFTGDIFRIRLMGGEPFLNQELDKYLSIVREYFPHTDVHLVSNGLLIMRISEKVINSITDNRIVIDISDYAPTRKVRDRIDDFANVNGIRINWTTNVRKDDCFLKTLSIKEIDDKKCGHCETNLSCINIYKGRYAKCPQLMYISKFNSYFGESIPSEGIYDLFETGITADKFIDNLVRSEKICKHCDMANPEWFEWFNYSAKRMPSVNDWLISE